MSREDFTSISEAIVWILLCLFCLIGIHALPHDAAAQNPQMGEFMREWLVLGPIPVFDGEADPDDQESQSQAFAKDFLVQHGGETSIQPEADLLHTIQADEYRWQLVKSDADIVDLVKVYGEKEFVVAYAWSELEVPEERNVILGIGSDDGVKVWVNGEAVHENWIGRPASRDDDIVPATLRQGTNQILIKVQNMAMGWGFACRMLSPGDLVDKFRDAAGRGDLDLLRTLLDHDVDPNATGDHPLSALQYARLKGRVDVVDLLIEHGADADLPMPSSEQLIDALFEQVIQEHGPGAAVLAARDGQIIYQRGFGLASVEHDVPIIPDTKFRIGSISKQFTAAAILKLQEEGKLSVEDPLTKFLPDYPRGDEVTLHHLLTHTSGIQSYTEKSDFLSDVTAEVKPEDLIDSFKDDPYNFDPGEQWLYNNSGYFLLSYIVEQVSGESFDSYLKRVFLEPLGMANTGVHHWSAILEHEATGYSYENGEFKKALDWDMSRAGGAGALYSTVGDLHRWNEAIFDGEVLSKESLDAAFTPVVLNNGEQASGIGGGYGYGWMLSERRGLQEIAHGGGLHGWNTYLTRYPEHDLTIAVLCNVLPLPPGLSPAMQAREIADILLWEQMEEQESYAVSASMDLSKYDAYVGRYAYPQGTVLTVTREGDRLFAQLTAQPKFEIFPKSDDEFFWKVVDAQVVFVTNEAGVVTHVIHHQGGSELEASRLPDEAPADVDASVYDAYVGEYDLKQVGTLTITKEGDKLFIQATNQPKFQLHPRSETEFYLKEVNATLIFVKDESDTVTKAVLHQAGMEMEAPRIK